MKQLLYGEAIVKSYGKGEERCRVLDGVSVEISEGEFVSVMGPSGSGKSTLLFALSGMDRIDSGKVTFEGMDLSGLPDDSLADLRRNKMGFVFQQPTLLKNLNLLDNMILPMMRDHRKDVEKLVRKAKALMKQMGIGELGQRDITQVSGGQLQRAGICRALMSDPKIIFGDEPTGALNSKSAREVMDLFAEINGSGTAVLLVTHDAGIAARSGRVLFMRDGNIVDELNLPSYQECERERRIGLVTQRMGEIGI